MTGCQGRFPPGILFHLFTPPVSKLPSQECNITSKQSQNAISWLRHSRSKEVQSSSLWNPRFMSRSASTKRLSFAGSYNGPQIRLSMAAHLVENPHMNSTHMLSLPSFKRILENSPLDRPTYLIQWNCAFAPVQHLTHLDGNLFNSPLAFKSVESSSTGVS